MPNVELDNLVIEELKREKEMFETGRQRYLDRLEKSKPSDQHHPNQIILEALPRTVEAITQEIAKAKIPSKGRPPSWLADVEDIDPYKLGVICLNVMMDGVAISAAQTSIMKSIGRRIYQVKWFQGLKTEHPKFAEYVNKKVTKTQDKEYMRIKAAQYMAAKKGYVYDEWSADRMVKAAEAVLNPALEASNVFETWIKTVGNGKTKRMIGLNDASSLLLANREYDSAWGEPYLGNMITVPNKWTSFTTGGYLDELTASMVPLVRKCSFQQKKSIEAKLKVEPNPEYLKALNAIQETPLDMNRYVLQAVKHAWDRGAIIGKFPVKTKLQPLVKEWDFDQKTPNQKRAWNNKDRKIRLKNREIDGAIALMSQDLAAATELCNYECLYTVWNFCSRGRAYPVPNFSYHRDDHIKACFNLKNGKALDENGVYWLAVQIANVGDFEAECGTKLSKLPFDDRVLWVEANQEFIYDIGRNSNSTTGWHGADKPFQFLAACNAWANYMDWGDEYLCQLPISHDASNSGTQHYSAASKNDVDGALVNLLPGDKPKDVYAKVCDVVLEKIDHLKKTHIPVDDKDKTLDYIKAWETPVSFLNDEGETVWVHKGVTRATLKRNVMTFCYSSARYGFSEQLYDDIVKKIDDYVLAENITDNPFGVEQHEQRKACRFLAKLNYDAVCQVLSSVSIGMKFFQVCAGALAHEGKHVKFENPVGFSMQQKYTFWDVKKVRIFLFDRVTQVRNRSQISVRTNNNQHVDKRKSKNAIAPNIIHSMDSSHLLKTVLAAKAKGVRDFFLIHDAFGTTACDIEKMYHSIRESFVDLYDDYCLYQDFYSQVNKQLSDDGRNKLNVTIPPKGNLDLNTVLDSEYCFS